jgi:hypothetical protein
MQTSVYNCPLLSYGVKGYVPFMYERLRNRNMSKLILRGSKQMLQIIHEPRDMSESEVGWNVFRLVMDASQLVSETVATALDGRFVYIASLL